MAASASTATTPRSSRRSTTPCTATAKVTSSVLEISTSQGGVRSCRRRPQPRRNRAGHGKLKFLRNIKKLLASSRRSHGHDRKSKKAAPDDDHLEKAMRWLSSSNQDALGGDSSYESTPLSSCDRTPLSSVTTVDLHACARAGEAPSTPRLEAKTRLARSKSDNGASFRREATRYHALRPDRPAGPGTDGFHSPEKNRRYSDELRSS
ncbi:hypothetical protein ZWY2020_011311 [Hordeum vulgare]|nr:hypothetical protein ZWY2020_011311 [Hordeum vulgare]